jgi:hypothetical protein
MTSANQAYREAANSPAGHRAPESAKSAAESARSMGEQIADVAGDVSDLGSIAALKTWLAKPVTMPTQR